ncbi:hypothetical protein KKC97_02950 [bacterium]|nr:hypothetical protein [bacterium]MBU1636602.1 hypothetical protein [bacterium]MBU1921015.1 hypothetical protein [bacterium]
MKALRIVLTILILGALWGAVELMSLPTFLYISAGILFLTIGRTLMNKVGTSIAIGIVVCALKIVNFTYFFACMWGGILAVAVSFDLLATLFWKEESWSVVKASVLGFAGAAVAAPLFIVWVLWLVPEPRWVEGGLSLALEYFTTTGLYSALFSLVVAAAGFMLGGFLKKWYPAERKAISHS